MAEASRPDVASVKQVKALAQDMAEEFLQCRDLRHSWRPYKAGEIPKEDRKKKHGARYERVLRCNVCGVERVQRFTTTMHKLTDYPRYPEGYLLPGVGRIAGKAAEALRLVSFQRQMEELGG